MIVNAVDHLGAWVIRRSGVVRDFSELVLETGYAALTPPWRVREIVLQIYFIANQSAVTVAFCVTFAAMVTVIESSFHMKLVIQNDSMVPGFAAALILRELGSVVMALLVTSRVGAGYAAEIGTMKITEQIEALRMLGLDPIRYLVAPRFIAGLVSGVLLAIIANLVCLTGAMAVSTLKLGYTAGSFLSALQGFVHFRDLGFAVLKGAAFGAVIPLFSCYFGFRCEPGAEGVGLATTNSVVATSVAIIILDFVLTLVFTSFY